MWRLSSCDLAEIARNSGLQSSFEPCVKAAGIGRNYRLGGTEGNDIQKTNLPNLRVHFRRGGPAGARPAAARDGLWTCPVGTPSSSRSATSSSLAAWCRAQSRRCRPRCARRL